MKIGLISDTHLPNIGHDLPPQIINAFKGVDLILHAGDVYSSECLDWLEQIAPILAVEVPPALCMSDPRVEFKRVVEVGGHRIGMMHDLQIPGIGWELEPGLMEKKFPKDWSLPERLEKVFGSPVDTIVTGHTHIPMVETYQGILLVNPGSPTLPRLVRKLGTVGILELTPAGRDARILNLAEH